MFCRSFRVAPLLELVDVSNGHLTWEMLTTANEESLGCDRYTGRSGEATFMAGMQHLNGTADKIPPKYRIVGVDEEFSAQYCR